MATFQENININIKSLSHFVGWGGGLLVSVLALYSEDPSSYPAGYLNFLNEKTKINEKDSEIGPSLKK